ADTAPKIMLVLALLVSIFGIYVVVSSRRNRAATNHVTSQVASHETSHDTSQQDLSVRDRISKTRSSFAGAISIALTRSSITQQTWDELEEALLRADVGVTTTTRVLAPLRELVKSKKIVQPNDLAIALQNEMTAQLSRISRELNFDSSLGAPNIWLVVGVNGAGKTTTIGKLSAQQRALGRSVLLAAGDTFRAAAGEQLETWALRSGAEIVRGAEGGDPSSVIFDGIARATAQKIDLVLADTAGRLQNNTNLMEELAKVRRVADKASGKVTEVLLVIDATTGQNGLTQANQFSKSTQVTGIVLTKLDGSAKGGIVFAIETELGIPIKLVGLGENINDLVAFNAAEFVSALFD
ncbi:MAG: signal recognition particle-docking protein FtsY, partial [Actinobacteria bacterium]|nr:signal recognition particle-docking protein FtsY [Actinomycetota bacterium]